VLALSDNLGFGPINPPDLDIRFTWMKKEFGAATGEWEWLPAATKDFWEAALSSADRRIVWTSRRTVLEYSGFLELVRRLITEPYDVVDLTDAEIVRRRADGTISQGPAVSLSLLNPKQVDFRSLVDMAQPLAAMKRDQYRKAWEQLRAEDAPLRVIRDRALVSAPITFFDPIVLRCASQHWSKYMRLVGKALAETFDEHAIQTDDLVLAARVRALVANKQLQLRGNPDDWQGSEVRLAGPAA
jgi:hypothetical protein